MNTLPICSFFSLSTTGCQPYRGMAFDGCRFYLTQPQHCRIQTFNACFQRQEAILTCRPYACLCYDRTEHCFWASGEQEADTIFKLNCHFVEVACLHIISTTRPTGGLLAPIRGSYRPAPKDAGFHFVQA